MEEYPPVLDLNKLKEEMNLTDEAIQNSAFSPVDLQTIYVDYLDRLKILEPLKDKFVSNHIVAARGIHLHSYSGRVKHPYHLIEKIIRKRSTNDPKYRSMTTADYYKYITDLIGCRILLVYKEDWKPIHDYLTSIFPHRNYIDKNDYAKSYDNAPIPPFMAEPPVAHMRLGDAEIYPANDLEVKRDRYYRSLHYIVRYEEYYIEIQVRTLFEEAWGEVDHDVLYPYYKDDPVLVNFSKLINRAAGMSDEMSAYFRTELSKGRPRRNGVLLDVPISVPRSSDLMTVSPCPGVPSPPLLDTALPSNSSNSSGQDILNSLLYRNEV